MTVFDARKLHHLVEVTDDPDFVAGLVATYRNLLDRRVERIIGTVGSGDVEAALDAARSLKGGSLMTGAVELAWLATLIESDLRTGDLAASRSRLALLEPAAVRVRRALDAHEQGRRSAGLAQASVDSIR